MHFFANLIPSINKKRKKKIPEIIRSKAKSNHHNDCLYPQKILVLNAESREAPTWGFAVKVTEGI